MESRQKACPLLRLPVEVRIPHRVEKWEKLKYPNQTSVPLWRNEALDFRVRGKLSFASVLSHCKGMPTFSRSVAPDSREMRQPGEYACSLAEKLKLYSVRIGLIQHVLDSMSPGMPIP